MFSVKKKVPIRIATTPRRMAILACWAVSGRCEPGTARPIATAPNTQPAIDTGLVSAATMPTIRAAFVMLGLSIRAVFLRASLSSLSANGLSAVIAGSFPDDRFLGRGRVPPAGVAGTQPRCSTRVGRRWHSARSVTRSARSVMVGATLRIDDLNAGVKGTHSRGPSGELFAVSINLVAVAILGLRGLPG